MQNLINWLEFQLYKEVIKSYKLETTHKLFNRANRRLAMCVQFSLNLLRLHHKDCVHWIMFVVDGQ